MKLPTTVDEPCEMNPLLPKVCNCVHVFESPSSDDGVVRHVPFTEKQPAVILMPLPAEVVAEPMASEPTAAACAERFVDDAVVAKVLVEVEFAKVALPVTVRPAI